MVVGRIAAGAAQIVGQSRSAGGFPLQPVQGFLSLGNAVPGVVDQLIHPFFQGSVADVALGKPEQQRPKHRKQHHQDQPGELYGGVHFAVEQVQDHHCGKEQTAPKNMGQETGEPAEHAEQQEQMKGQQQTNEPQPAENQMDQPLLSLAQQRQSLIVFFVH